MKALTGQHSSQLLELFQNEGISMQCKRGEVIVSAGDEPESVYLITDGYVKVYSINNRGEEYVHLVYRENELFPVMWVMVPIKKNVFYEALTLCSLLRMPLSQFNLAIRLNNSLSMEMLNKVISQLSMLYDRIDNLEYKYARERLIYRLLFLASRFGIKQGKTCTIQLGLSQQLIASTINLSRESVGRELDRLVQKEMISFRGRFIVLEDIDQLIKELPGNAISPDWWGLV